ncbi:hypothetical protein [Fodinicola feengrottensis]|uniref:IrrE N-terminal-like domain-containing protein n=1 Tax=Fodinicola feengrottensis TaxID=435914 RepID=A0ABP4UAN4_9ACTN|nr:hypothetical protein [Fodinicola feengrottensis]
MKPPRKVKVGPISFTVASTRVGWKAAVDREGSVIDSEDYGVAFPWLGEIAVNPAHPPTVQRLTTVHELLHALLALVCGSPDFRSYFKGSTGQIAAEERLVRLLEAPLLSLIRDNPRLMEYLTSKD